MKSFKELNIIFLGTPDFAVATLDALVRSGAQVVAVVTAPDKPSGRGLQLQPSAVKKYALSHHIPVLQPVKLKDPEFLAALHSFKADVQVVVAFRMLPEVVWNMPPMGTINVHASLLPNYRGAAPINWAVINGEKETGVTTFKLKHEIDTGNILLQEKIDILPQDNAGTIHDKLMSAGAQLLVKTLQGLAQGSIAETPQAAMGSAIQHAPKIFKEDMRIDWNQPATTIHNRIRGLSPYPTAFTMLNDKQLKLFVSRVEIAPHQTTAGMVETDHETYLRFATTDGWIYAEEVQLEGKKRMAITDFLRGFRS